MHSITHLAQKFDRYVPPAVTPKIQDFSADQEKKIAATLAQMRSSQSFESRIQHKGIIPISAALHRQNIEKLRDCGWKGRGEDVERLMDQLNLDLQGMLDAGILKGSILLSKDGKIRVISSIRKIHRNQRLPSSKPMKMMAETLYNYLETDNLLGLSSLLIILGTNWPGCHKGRYFASPIDYATYHLKQDALNLFLEYGIQVSFNAVYFLPTRKIPTAEEENRIIKICELLERLAKANGRNFYSDLEFIPTLVTCAVSSMNLMNSFLQKGLTFNPSYALSLAIKLTEPNPDIIEWLIKKQGANPHYVNPIYGVSCLAEAYANPNMNEKVIGMLKEAFLKNRG